MLDSSVIASLQKGNKKALKSVFDAYFHSLCGFAFSYIAHREESEDAVQETFITLWEKRANFQSEGEIRAFLYTALRNRCLNIIKHQKVISKHEQALVYELESERFFTENVIKEQVFNELYQEIKKLPEAAQKIMLLALKGMKNKEIAMTLKISENTVKTQKKIAYAKLKDNLGSVFSAILLAL